MRRPTPPGAASRLLPLALLGALRSRAWPPRRPGPPPRLARRRRRRQAARGARHRSPAPRTPGDSQNVEVDPIRCWTRTSAGAVRIGEPFAYMLTCAVIETEAVQVVADESRLGITVVQMTPFEVVGGTHPDRPAQRQPAVLPVRILAADDQSGCDRPGRRPAAASTSTTGSTAGSRPTAPCRDAT